MKGDPFLNHLARKEKRTRRVQPGAVCEVCGGTDYLVAKADGAVRCRAHRDRREWYPDPRFEVDHFAGRVNVGGLTMELEQTAHRDVTEFRIAAGKDDWPGVEGDPLVAVAHALGGIASLLWAIAKWLIRLARWLGETIDDDWHEGAPQGPVR
jgi:hypothetical protein